MKKLPVPEVVGAHVIEFDRYEDNRGHFQEVFSTARYESVLYHVSQINVSCSQKNVVRGMHIAPFAKLCTCVRGSLFDVVADVRRGSPTFGKWFGVWLTEQNCKQLYVPPGCAHGIFVAENDTLLMYAQNGLYDPATEKTVHWQDPQLGIVWPEAEAYIVSDKDKVAKGLADVV